MGINVQFEAGSRKTWTPMPRSRLAPVAGLAFVMPKCFGELIFGVNDVQF